MPSVSVIIPTFNAAKYIGDTIKSILCQSYQDFEILIIDDKSTDNTELIVKSFKSKKIKYITLKKNHGGPSKPRNEGVKSASGKYIAFCDADDLFCQGRVKSAVDLLKDSPELGLVFTNEMKFDDNTGKDVGDFLSGYEVFWSLPKKLINDNQYLISSEDAFKCLFYENYIMPSGVTVPASVFKNLGLFDENLKNSDDRDMWFRISQKYKIGFIDKIGFRYRIRANSISARGRELFENRIITIRKQLTSDISAKLRTQCHNLISQNLFSIGYYYQNIGDMKAARKFYIKSMNEKSSYLALKGIFVSFICKDLYLYLKKNIG